MVGVIEITKTANEIRDALKNTVKAIDPIDGIESEHRKDALEWIASGAEVYRIEKPDKPPKHFVSYVVPVDVENRLVLLVDHIKARLWLPPGGHVERNEFPDETARRECLEELGITAEFLFGPKPFFITQAVTVGQTAGHTDVSLWYVIKMNSRKDVVYDKHEFNSIRWFGFEELMSVKRDDLDPHFIRFMRKLQNHLALQ